MQHCNRFYADSLTILEHLLEALLAKQPGHWFCDDAIQQSNKELWRAAEADLGRKCDLFFYSSKFLSSLGFSKEIFEQTWSSCGQQHDLFRCAATLEQRAFAALGPRGLESMNPEPRWGFYAIYIFASLCSHIGMKISFSERFCSILKDLENKRSFTDLEAFLLRWNSQIPLGF